MRSLNKQTELWRLATNAAGCAPASNALASCAILASRAFAGRAVQCALASLIACTLSLSSAYANDESLETINVVAEEPASQTGDVQHEEHAGTHRHISQQELEREDVRLGDILAHETGVQFRQVGGLGTLSTVTLRGSSSAATDIFLDGILLNSASNSSIDLSLLELLNLSSVDIYQGKAPAQLASSNLGGAINLRSLGFTTSAPSTSAALTGGSFNTNRLQLSHRSKYQAWDVVAAASREASENNFSFLNNNATPFNTNDDRTEQRNNAQVAKLSGLARIGLQWNTDTRSDLLIQATNRQLGIPEWLNSADNVASFDTESVEIQLSNEVNGIGNWNTSFSLFHHSQENHFLDQFSQIGLGAQNNTNDNETTGVKSYWEHIGDTGTFTFNASVRNETLNSIDVLDDIQNYSAKRYALIGGIQYAYFMANEKLLFTPALRFNAINDTYSGIRRSNRNEISDTAFTPQIGVKYTPNSKLAIHSTVGQFVRQPSFSEMFGSRGLILGNGNLLPEQGVNTEVGMTFTPSNQLVMNASAFANFRDELIVLSFDSQGVGRSLNSGQARVYGLEFDTSWIVNSQLQLRFNTTYQVSQNLSENPGLNKLELPGESRLTSFAKLQYKNKRVRTWLETNYKSDFYYDYTNLLPGKAQWIHSAGIEYQLHAFTLGLSANNLGNAAVEDYNGFPRPGRSFYLSINYRL